ncbi:F-box/FBD/LRR-repeat protein At1g13570-like [Silene latifolia]|uniref:F-box/FBD/LRR-repeat protein At1g13570-like n=1 Tax=Silene latifolia TaxID=37657 RepID=UPI003D773562
MASSESLETNNDLISIMPAIVTDKILKHLPLKIAAKTSILSRTWRRIWLSCPYLTFDETFWAGFHNVDSTTDWQKGSCIINNILLHHNASIHSFYVVLKPNNADADLLVDKNASLSQWLSVLAKTCTRKLVLRNCARKWHNLVILTSYIFHCTKLTKLRLHCFVLIAPPFDFKGFPHLKHLELYFMKFNRGLDMLWSIIAKCPCLVFLRLDNCLGVDILNVDAPRLEKLIIRGISDSLCLKKAPRLTDVLLCSINSKMKGIKTVVATIKSLSSSYNLQSLEIEGNLSKLLAAGGINKSLPVAFNCLHRLCLAKLDLSDSDVFCFTHGMLQSCPVLRDLEISIISPSNAVGHSNVHQSNHYNYELRKLQKVKITGITGSSAELKFIEYVLAKSVVLEIMFFKCGKQDVVSEHKVLKQLIRFPRASTKAQFVYMEE